MSAPLVLTSTAPSADAATAGPCVDFVEIARALGARLLYPPIGGGLLARLERKTASDLRQAWAASRADASVYLSLSEKVGLPLALLNRKRTPHVLLAHHLTSPRKRALQKRTGWLHRFERIIVLCRAQEAYLRDEVGLPEGRVRRIYHQVDHGFFAPQGGATGNYILSVGREKRDYETLMAAVAPLGVPTIIVASSPWARGGETRTHELPPNVSLKRGVSYPELRALYDQATLVVVPLQAGTEYAAGSTGVLEAMAMRKPLIVTHTPGIADYVDDAATARAVPPADPGALGAAIRELLADRARAERLATGARRVVDAGRNLETYVRSVVSIAREVARS